MIGSIFSGAVRDLSSKGLGVVDHPDGIVFFVSGTWPGDEGTFEVTGQEKRFGFAKLLELNKPSPQRRTAPCPHQGHQEGQCGGCPWMIGSYESQLAYKEKFLLHQLQREKVFSESTTVHPIVPSVEFEYRNRAQFKTDGKQLGYVSEGSHTLATIKDCMILNPTVRSHLHTLLEKLPNPNWKPPKDFQWSFLEADDQMDISNIQPNVRRPFRQGNSQQNEFMKDWLKKSLSRHNRSETIYEFFCGSGNFTKTLADLKFQNILAVEASRVSIEALKAKNLAGVTAVECNLYLPKLWKELKLQQAPSVLILDPPREGFEHLTQFIYQNKSIKNIYYISCNAQTFTKDIKPLIQKGWKLQSVTPVDQFPQTPHLEILSSLRL